ncbi:DUF4329 domain-containing protein [Alphaproteobacteria bacterium KMM 3653]|uniref:DUF4329 domain-containing protein n=1 Tax=Harenicola maris TaxID=2841044 RepID=A0AAP2G8M7_9RHOB|nr:DUF4329 domain-containing protein [Harenicola maris]
MISRLFWAMAAAFLGFSDAGAQSAREVAAIKQVFAKVQPKSFAANREYCGYIGWSRDGTLAVSRMKRGRTDQCRPPRARHLHIIASWHTHAAYDPEALSEVPSVTDILADADEGIDGYLATPGGRLWYIDTTDMEVTQLCGLGCLPRDPAFLQGSEGPILQSYSYRDLLRRENEITAQN